MTERLALTVPELAEALGLGRAAAYRLARTPGFPALIVGKRIIIPLDGLRRWLDAQSGAEEVAACVSS